MYQKSLGMVDRLDGWAYLMIIRNASDVRSSFGFFIKRIVLGVEVLFSSMFDTDERDDEGDVDD